MLNSPLRPWYRALLAVTALLIVKVTIVVMAGYQNYFPANFSSDFLQGRDRYFYGSYQWAFYPHIVSGPITLFLGMLLISDTFRARYPIWHRYLGRVQVACVLLVIVPSGLWMAWYAAAGPVAAASFAALAVMTGICTAMGWRMAVKRQFAVHRQWMWRSFLLLCSAVVLRIVGGLATVLAVGVDWFDPMAAWACWLVPLTAYEIGGLAKRNAWFAARAKPAALPTA